jgi:serine/threonine-protein kinase RsbW
MPSGERIARLEFSSALDMLDFVEIVSDHVSRSVGFDEDTGHWVGLALRESVINAIKHGNKNDTAKHVVVEFTKESSSLILRVRDQGAGFDPSVLSDPLAPENLLSPSGRGIFLIRSFMDDVRIERVPEGGMEVSMTKHV